MDRFDLDRFTVDYVYRLYKDGRLNLAPDYQRGRVWNDSERYALVESIKEEFPIGLVMWNVVEHVDKDGVKVEKYDAVDGQQRLTTVIEYIDGALWATSEHTEDFEPFVSLSEGRKIRFWQYRIPVASMKGFEPDEVAECYNRLQRGKPLKIGEKLKAQTTSGFHPLVKELTRHRLFELAGGRLKTRDGHWTISTAILRSIYTKELFARQEYKHLSEFLRGHVAEKKAQKALEECRRILNFEAKALELALKDQPDFERYVGTAL